MSNMNPLDIQVGGSHYKKLKIQPAEYNIANNIRSGESDIVQYITRWRDKGGFNDLDKIKHWVDLIKELETKYNPDAPWVKNYVPQKPPELKQVSNSIFKNPEIASRKHVMIDIETLGVSPGCIVHSLGVVTFELDPQCESINSLQEVIFSIDEQERKGLLADENTLKWWRKRKAELEAIKDPTNAQTDLLKETQHALKDYRFQTGLREIYSAIEDLKKILSGTDGWILCKGASFDFPILEYFFDKFGEKNILSPYYKRLRCWRTLEEDWINMLEPGVMEKYEACRSMGNHNALMDATAQAKNMIALFNLL